MPEIKNKTVTKAALLGRDYPGTRFDVLVQVGDPVLMGQPVMRDRRRPDILFTSPIAGTVTVLSRGRKRSVVSLQVEVGSEPVATVLDVQDSLDADSIRDLMLRSGIWTTLRQRPFGTIPDPHDRPTAFLITAIDTQPLAPDPEQVIALQPEAFSKGAEMLAKMVDVPVYICKSPDTDLPEVKSGQVRIAEFVGPHPAGLPGVHIHRLCPVGSGSNSPWHIGYQDVISLGHLVNTGRTAPQKVVSIGGPALHETKMLSVSQGASVEDIINEEVEDEEIRVISGSLLNGHDALGDEGFLGQRHNQITVLPVRNNPVSDWKLRSFFEISPGSHITPLIPTTDLDRAAPPGVLPVPMMRALLVGDTERARDLGALELVEEDVAMLGLVCPSKTDYGALLRDVLSQLQKEQSAAV
ncbi:MAG: hypothetical protein WBM41_05610 [Arenicellales bacterium]